MKLFIIPIIIIIFLMGCIIETEYIPIEKSFYIIYQNNSSHQISLTYSERDDTTKLNAIILLEPQNKIVFRGKIFSSYLNSNFGLSSDYQTVDYFPQQTFSKYNTLYIKFDSTKYSFFESTSSGIKLEDMNFANPQYYNYKLANNLPFLKQAFENNIDTLWTYYFTDSNYSFAQFIKK